MGRAVKRKFLICISLLNRSVVNKPPSNSPRFTPANSNTRINIGGGPARPRSKLPPAPENLGLNSERLRQALITRLREQGISNEAVLNAMRAVPRHKFVDEGLASRSYDDVALPIGYSQTISQPWVVARMLSVVCENKRLQRVLEVGAGCGYQAAVLAHLVPEVYAIERVRGLYEQAIKNLRAADLLDKVNLVYGDGMEGLKAKAPFDAIVVAAAAAQIPQALLNQLAVGGRLVAPEGTSSQLLVLIERKSASRWQRHELEAVRFVPLISGTQL